MVGNKLQIHLGNTIKLSTKPKITTRKNGTHSVCQMSVKPVPTYMYVHTSKYSAGNSHKTSLNEHETTD